MQISKERPEKKLQVEINNINNDIKAADLCFSDFVPGQFHHCKVPFPQGPDDFIEADLQRPPLGRARLSSPVGFCHDYHGVPTDWGYSTVINEPAETAVHITHFIVFV